MKPNFEKWYIKNGKGYDRIDLVDIFAEEYAKEIVDKAANLLNNVDCPYCDGSGTIIEEILRSGSRTIDDGNGNPIEEEIPIVDYQPYPCEWCATKKELIASKK